MLGSSWDDNASFTRFLRARGTRDDVHILSYSKVNSCEYFKMFKETD